MSVECSISQVQENLLVSFAGKLSPVKIKDC